MEFRKALQTCNDISITVLHMLAITAKLPLTLSPLLALFFLLGAVHIQTNDFIIIR